MYTETRFCYIHHGTWLKRLNLVDTCGEVGQHENIPQVHVPKSEMRTEDGRGCSRISIRLDPLR